MKKNERFTWPGKFDTAIEFEGCSMMISNWALNEGSSKQGLLKV